MVSDGIEWQFLSLDENKKHLVSTRLWSLENSFWEEMYVLHTYIPMRFSIVDHLHEYRLICLVPDIDSSMPLSKLRSRSGLV